jgi:hypothetical protein
MLTGDGRRQRPARLSQHVRQPPVLSPCRGKRSKRSQQHHDKEEHKQDGQKQPRFHLTNQR